MVLVSEYYNFHPKLVIDMLCLLRGLKEVLGEKKEGGFGYVALLERHQLPYILHT